MMSKLSKLLGYWTNGGEGDNHDGPPHGVPVLPPKPASANPLHAMIERLNREDYEHENLMRTLRMSHAIATRPPNPKQPKMPNANTADALEKLETLRFLAEGQLVDSQLTKEHLAAIRLAVDILDVIVHVDHTDNSQLTTMIMGAAGGTHVVLQAGPRFCDRYSGDTAFECFVNAGEILRKKETRNS